MKIKDVFILEEAVDDLNEGKAFGCGSFRTTLSSSF